MIGVKSKPSLSQAESAAAGSARSAPTSAFSAAFARAGRCRHAPEGDACASDARAVETQLERPQDRRDVLVEALGNLVAPERFAGRQLGHADGAHEFARLAPLAAIGDEEVFQGKLADRRAALEHERRAERDQGRGHVADRRAVGDVAAERADIAHLLAGEPAQQFAEIGIDRSEIRRGGGVGRGGTERHRLRAIRDGVEALGPSQPDDPAEVAHLLGDPQADIGRAGDQYGIGILRIECRQRLDAGRGGEEALGRTREQVDTVIEARKRAGDLGLLVGEAVAPVPGTGRKRRHLRSGDSRCSGTNSRRSSHSPRRG